MNGVLSSSPASQSRRTHQRGSALLIVLVFAAIVAILLFMQMPVLIFEAQRNKEQLLVDRGNEYKQGIRLYYRKFQRYPPSFDALENTNRVRFLRKRFKDPFTDKDDWRLIHAGPNGIPIDSKLKIAQPQAGAQTSSGGGNSPLGSFNNGQNQSGGQSPFGGSNTFSGSSGFGNSGFGSSGSSGSTGFGGSPSNPGGTGGGGLGNSNSFGGFNSPSRAPQPVNSGSSSAANPPGFEGGIAPNADGVDPNVVPSAPSQAHGVNGLPLPAGENGGALQAATPSGVPQPVITRSAVPNGTNGSATGAAAPSQFSQSAGGGASQPSADAFNPNGAVNSLLSNPNPQTPQTAGAAGFNTSTGIGGGSTFGGSSTGRSSPFGSSSSNSSSGFGVIQSGGLGGVASKAERHSIKLINDQQQYSLWEFYYDPNKDPLRNGAGALNQIGGGNGASAQFGNTGIGAAPGSSGTNGATNSLFTRGPSPFADSNNGPSNFGNPGPSTGAAPSSNPQTPATPAAPPQ